MRVHIYIHIYKLYVYLAVRLESDFHLRLGFKIRFRLKVEDRFSP